MATRRHIPFVILGLLLLCGGCSGLGDPNVNLWTEPAAPKPLAVRQTPIQAQPTPEIRPVSFDESASIDDSHPSIAVDPSEPLPLPQDTSTGTGALQVKMAAQNAAVAPDVIILDLTDALAIAAGQNPRIAYASARYREAYARLQFARTAWLPSIRAGLSHNHHDGPLQASNGLVLDASRSSLQAGLGVGAVGAGSPTVPGLAAEFHATDAYFQPKIAERAVGARQAAKKVATNDTILATALAYLEVLRAKQQLRISEETRDNAKSLADLTATFARTGQGSQADADRTQTEFALRRVEVARAEEAAQVATARLVQLLSLEALLEVEPQETTIVPVELVSLALPVNELVATGLSNRPELAEAQNLVCEAVYRYRREKYAPLLPSVLLGISQSGFGGGFGSEVRDSGGRLDWDATVYWELRNFGFGERAKRDETRSQYDQARALQANIMDQVAREVVEAHTQTVARNQQIAVAESAIESATNSYQRNLSRVREGQGLPIEVLQSLQALDTTRHEYLRTLADYNEAQFRLQRALGWPIH